MTFVAVRRSLAGGCTSAPQSLPGEGVGQKVTTLTRFLEALADARVEEELEVEFSFRPPPRLNCSNRSFGRELREAKVR